MRTTAKNNYHIYAQADKGTLDHDINSIAYFLLNQALRIVPNPISGIRNAPFRIFGGTDAGRDTISTKRDQRTRDLAIM